ncbi:MAG: serine/threonine protein kinase [Polyangiales bacterium]
MSLGTIGRYELLTEIASGGMATVYAARVRGAQGFEKLVALKRMLPSISADSEFQKMFLDEGRLAAHIRSSYVVSTFDLQRHDDGSLYLVMDLVIGASLAYILHGSAGAPLPVPAVLQIIQHAARGLHDAHEASSAMGQALHIVHRDISPQNILVGLDGSTRITDFGIAQAEERLAAKTGARSIKGKLAYFSPEQARGEHVDGRSDLFSLGIVLWETLTQRRLFHRGDARETLSAVVGASIPDPRTFRPGLTPELAALVMKALERDPAERFQTGLAFAEALTKVSVQAQASDVQALVHTYASNAVDPMVAALRHAIRSAQPSGAAAKNGEHAGIRVTTLATAMMKKIDTGQLRAANVTGPLLAPNEDLVRWHGQEPEAQAPAKKRPRVRDPKLEVRSKRYALMALILGVLVAIAAGSLLALIAGESTPDVGAVQPPGVLPSPGHPEQAEDLGAAIAEEAAAATRFIEGLGNAPASPPSPSPSPSPPLPPPAPVEDSEPAAEAPIAERAETLRGVECWPFRGHRRQIPPGVVEVLEYHLSNVQCPPEAHRFGLAFEDGALVDTFNHDSARRSRCFREGIREAADQISGFSGVIYCRTSD